MQPQILYVLDPGHGGHEQAGRSSPSGVRGPHGLVEKDVTLDIARRVRARLGGSALLTRDGDVNRTIAARAGIAMGAMAPAFVSIHAGGRETYVHRQASQNSVRLAELVDRELGRIEPRGVLSEELGVLTPTIHHPNTAACLVEVGRLASAQDEARFGDPSVLEAIAGSIAEGLTKYNGAAGRYGLGIVSVDTTPVSRNAQRQLSSRTHLGRLSRSSVSFDYNELWVVLSGTSSTDASAVTVVLTDDWGNNQPYLCAHAVSLRGETSAVLRFYGFPPRPDSNPMRSCYVEVDNTQDRGNTNVSVEVWA